MEELSHHGLKLIKRKYGPVVDRWIMWIRGSLDNDLAIGKVEVRGNVLVIMLIGNEKHNKGCPIMEYYVGVEKSSRLKYVLKNTKYLRYSLSGKREDPLEFIDFINNLTCDPKIESINIRKAWKLYQELLELVPTFNSKMGIEESYWMREKEKIYTRLKNTKREIKTRVELIRLRMRRRKLAFA